MERHLIGSAVAQKKQAEEAAKTDLATLGPVLDDVGELQEALIDCTVVAQQLGVDQRKNVVHCHVHLDRNLLLSKACHCICKHQRNRIK